MRTAVIVNPRSDSGRTQRRWPELARRLRERAGEFETFFTGAPGHATELAASLLRQGYDRIIAAGGDGTVHETANGFLEGDTPIRREALLAVLPLGTGGDFQRSLGIRHFDDALDAIARGTPLSIDVGKLRYTTHDGAAASRYFCNVVSFGMGGQVALRSKNALTALGGRTAFLYATLEVFLRYRSKKVRLALDGEEAPRCWRILNVAVGNGRYHGGGMQVCPQARLDDGLLEVTVIESINMLTLARDLPVLYSDNIYAHPCVHHQRARRLRAESDEEVLIEVDGEALGRLPLEFSVLPRSLRILALDASRRS